MEVKLKVNITAEDYKSFLIDTIFHNKINVLIFIVCPVVVILCLGIVLFALGNPVFAVSVFSAVVLVVAAAFLFLFFKWQKKVKKLYMSDKSIQEEQHIVISDRGIAGSMEKGSFNYSREHFTDVIYGDKVVSVFLSERQAILLPRHCFNSKEEEKQVGRLIHSYCIRK